MTITEKAAAIRTALKNELGLNSRQVSVKVSGCGLDLRIKTRAPKGPIEDIAKRYEHVRRCEYSGDILGGGNTFVSVEYDRQVVAGLAAEASLAEAYTAALASPGHLTPIHGYNKRVHYGDHTMFVWDSADGTKSIQAVGWHRESDLYSLAHVLLAC